MKKPLLIAGGLLISGIAILYFKNALQSKQYKKLTKGQFLGILKKLKKENYTVLKQLSMMVTQLGGQFRNLSRQMIQQYLEGPQSPLKINELIDNNLAKVKDKVVNDFNMNMEVYKTDLDVKKLRDQFDRDFQASLQGRAPSISVKVPEFLTKQKILELENKLSQKRYLIQIDRYKLIKGKSQDELIANPDIFRGVKSPQQELSGILEEEGVGTPDQPALAVYQAAVSKYSNDPIFKTDFQKIQANYNQIMSKYATKMQKQTITEEELNELQDQIIFFENM